MSICDQQFDPNCDECYEVSRADNDLTFVYGLNPSTQYYLWVVDKFQNSYRKLFTSGVDGSFTINTSDSIYPSGLFNLYSGELEIFISSDIDGDTIIPLTIYATNYNCVLLNITSDSEINCEPFAPSGCDPAIVTDSDGITKVEVESGGTFSCTFGAPFYNMVVNVDGSEIYNEVWSSSDTNTININ